MFPSTSSPPSFLLLTHAVDPSFEAASEASQPSSPVCAMETQMVPECAGTL
ncbi:hypothetical protein PAXRUDRAFT_20864 [Paxillus rubicundulus Ve08.2h10]|uniref:Uncharacterized protein n=1 Tax=Paxillus rubicundulus Ve08.2h10 TaxID=930991 RepID=A0A0D0CRK5_9AGAM|nr:hypothetical protein PAXRUDRAFT_20864 [Paxillus rubicundulus Ve08.2h10]